MFEEFENDFLKFDAVKNKMSSRPDLHAFILLNRLDPQSSDIVAASEHDEIYLGADIDTVKKNATPDQLRDLHRCGVCENEEYDGLVMFV